MLEPNNLLEIENKEIDNVVSQVERLSPQEREIVYQKLEIYHGDLPHPSILEGYNALYSEAAKRIIENGIAETEHRRLMERNYLEKKFKERRLGQVLGFVVALGIIGCGTYLISKGHTVAGSILSGVTALGVIGLFTGNTKKEDED